MLESLSKYKHIIWDWNGTLLDDLDVSIEAMNKVLIKRNMTPVNCETHKRIFGFPVKNYYIDLGFDFEKEPFEVVANEFVCEYNMRLPICNLHEGAEKVLEKIKDAGIFQSILSAAPHNDLLKGLNELGILKYFYKVIGLSNNFAQSKVENGIMLIRELALKPSEVLLIGDTTHDYEVAAQLGVDCILISNGHQNSDRLEILGVKVIRSICDII